MAAVTDPTKADIPPPPYEESAASSSTAPNPTLSNAPAKARNGIPPHSRRSMEDEARPLPQGWIRQYDTKEHHQFFVDTNADPPRSMWHHPFDDDNYMNSLSLEEQSKIRGLHRTPTHEDLVAESSDDDHHDHIPAELPPRPTGSSAQPKGLSRLGRRMKDKLTNSTHEERERQRVERAREEQEAYERHQMYRQAMARAMETGQPQLIGKDKQGRDVYIEPPSEYGYGGGSGYPGAGGYGAGGYGYNPYTQGPYTNPNARFVRPQDPYSRPYYGGYGGGLGLPIGLGLGGGLLLGGLLGGGF